MRSLYGVLFLLWAAPCPAAQSPLASNALQTLPAEIYGADNAPVVLRVGNGGAGPTGILRALAEDFLTARQLPGAVAWYQNISRFTLQALHQQLIDVALVYEPESAQRAIRAGWAARAVPVFNDHFLLVGPQDNPAGLQPGDSARQAMARIAQQGELPPQRPLFLSRDDDSGTNHREQLLWVADGLMPWAEMPQLPWYQRAPVFPAAALQRADRQGLYTLTDRGTWLSQKAQLKNSRVWVQGGAELLNPCQALLSNQASPLARDFVDYLSSARAQQLIASFGVARFNGAALFTPAAQADFYPQALSQQIAATAG